MENNQILIKAEAIARKAHRGQKRKDGKPYISHPEAVANAFNEGREIKHKIVAWLHDVIEDIKLEPSDLFDEGIPFDLVKSIINISRVKGEDYIDYLLRVQKDEIATRVKIQDLKHNLSDLKPGNMRDKYLLALYILEERK